MPDALKKEIPLLTAINRGISCTLSILLSFDKGCWVMVLRAIIIIKTYYQKWVMIKAVLRMIMITGENKNYPDKSESVPLGYWEFIPGIV